ncbi:MAG: NACHT domain-containing protein [Candidatus Cloacimonetes bacterium]|nr:NACHT domain-containing protein [Candidatus Cloacimonadota bacterium]
MESFIANIQFKDLIPWTIAFIATLIAFLNYLNSRKQRKSQEKKELQEYQKKYQEKHNQEIKIQENISTYCDYIVRQFKYISLRGIGVGGITMELDKTYIKLRFRNHNLYKKLRQYELSIGNKIQTLTDTKNVSLNIEDIEQEGNPPRDFNEIFRELKERQFIKRNTIQILIVGHPGSGKTTLLKWIALQCCENKGMFLNFFPMFFSLKEIGLNPSLIKKNLLEVSKEHIISLGLKSDLIESAYENDNVFFLLDGLDEIADSDLRKRTIQWIEKQNIKKNVLLVSSRYSGLDYKGLNFCEEFQSLSIEDFSYDDIQKFINNWYLNVETANIDDELSREQAIKQTNELLNIFKKDNYYSLRLMAKNPLLLSIIAVIHYKKGKLPKYRFKLYEECIEVLADTWLEVNRKNEMQTNYSECLFLLSIIAVYMMKSNKRNISKKEILNVMKQNDINAEKQKVFFDDVVNKAGILVESEGFYEFIHLTFQEYLAAFYFSNSNNPLEILQYHTQSYWEETIKLFVNIGNSNLFFDEIVNNLEKEYYKSMKLWENCINAEIIINQVKSQVEDKFITKIYSILVAIDNSKENERLVVSIFPHYQLYTKANLYANRAKEVLTNSSNLMVKILCALILLHSEKGLDNETKKYLKSLLQTWYTNQSTEYGLRGYDYLIILTGLNGNYKDFISLMKNIKKNNNHFRLLAIIVLQDLQYIMELHSENTLYTSIKKIYNKLEVRDLVESMELKTMYSGHLSDLKYYLTYSKLDNNKSLNHILDYRKLENFELFDKKWEYYLKENYLQIQNNRNMIDIWIDNSLELLNKLDKKELNELFPN